MSENINTTLSSGQVISNLELTEKVKQESAFIETVMQEMSKVIVGQKYLLDRLMMALLCDGHVLLEGLPGLAKTLTIKTLADVLHVQYQRIQFTPDLLPSDLIGTMIFNQKTNEFTAKKGPLFTNLVLADEINRAPAKVQSALLEAMGERQITIGETTYPLEDPFVVLATQNPIEQEGTYTLPEAQMDRFLFKIKLGYPTYEEEKEILNRMSGFETLKANKVADISTLLKARRLCASIYIDEKVKDYILNIVFATREHHPSLQVGASPRATIGLTKAARAHAFIRGRGYVTPDDVKAVSYDVLRHRMTTSFEAEAEGLTTDDVIQKILERVESP
jgi:MoxR-like ATPase